MLIAQNANAEPVFLTYRAQAEIDAMVDACPRAPSLCTTSRRRMGSFIPSGELPTRR